jgi:hypothetical protein
MFELLDKAKWKVKEVLQLFGLEEILNDAVMR